MSASKFNVKIEGGSGPIFMGDHASVRVTSGAGRGGMLTVLLLLFLWVLIAIQFDTFIGN